MDDLPDERRSLWRDSYPDRHVYDSLVGKVEVDAAIVGAGITGLTTAYLLKQAGLRVAVLEKDTVGGGTTGRTTGKVTSQHGLIYHELIKHLGSGTARIYADANQAAVRKVSDIIKQEKIDCAWKRQDNYVFTTDPARTGRFRQEAEAAGSLGLPATFETRSPLPFGIKAAVRFSGQGHINAQSYALGLAEAVNGGGSHVFERSRVSHFKEGSPAQVRTGKGTVIAGSVVVATNVPTLPLIARGTYCFAEYPMESYIVAGPLPSASRLEGMYISPDKDNYSILPVTMEGRRMILIGGESHISGLRGSVRARHRRLAAYAAERFGVAEITHRWSDRDYLAYDYIPLAGKLYPWSENLYVATGFRKWGLSNGTASAMILSDTITGRPNPWAAAFSPHRLRAPAYFPRVAARHLLRRG